MGNGASAGIKAGVEAASESDLQLALGAMSAEAKAKLKAALDSPGGGTHKADPSNFNQGGPVLGEMTDEETIDAAKNPSERIKGIYERIKPNLEALGMTGYEFLLAGHHGTAKLCRGEPLAIREGVAAPDGTLHAHDSDAETTLHAAIKEGVKEAQLTCLLFGSFTCAMTQAKLKGLFEFLKPKVDAGKLFALQVYVGEAHADDGWSYPVGMPEAGPWGPKVPRYSYAQTLADKKKICVDWVAQRQDAFALLPGMPVLVDDCTTDKATLYAGPIELAYEARTCRVVILDKDLKVVHCTGAGPDQYDITKVEAFLSEKLG